MRKLLIFMMLMFFCNTQAQVLKKVYDELFKYSTLYVSGDISNSYENTVKDYFVQRPADNGLYDIPEVIDVTEYYPFDYRIAFGIRRLGLFDYEVKSKHYYDGSESTVGLSAPTAAVKGFEYLFNFELERERGEEFKNSRYFIRHTGKYHIVKLEQREQGNIGFKYQSAELRARIPLGRKLSISAGAIYRTHSAETGTGYNPIEIWLNRTDTYVDAYGNVIEYPINPWYTLGFIYGYTDHFTKYTDIQTGQERFDWIWKDSNGDIVAYSDIDFRNTIFGDLMNRWNEEQFAFIDDFGLISPIIGFDFYHNRNNFWTHIYGSYLPGYHKYIQGDIDFSYLNRNNYGKGGLRKDANLEQWEDYQFGAVIGWKIKRFGIFLEGEYTKFWDTEIYNSSIGINYRL
tara:strand:- start:865 stop:2067 length:1203 start_codon:yes stop_codon:yes gene_type:complete